MNIHKHVIFCCGSQQKVEIKKSEKFKPILIILVLDKWLKILRIGKKLHMYYSYYSQQKMLRLTYVYSGKHSPLSNLMAALKLFKEEGDTLSVDYYEIVVINKKILPLLQKNQGWEKAGKVWHFWWRYRKIR